ncbi:MAG TPA: hypothetical protein VLK29_06315 [Luteimonas sp.]|nr:hypothetical protein [Luteimonas sp.]
MSARPVGTWLLAIAGVAVLATVVAAMAVIGSPAEQRRQRFDEQRVRALETLVTTIGAHDASRRRLPASLAALQASPHGGGLAIVDPESGAPFGYRVTDARRYELCAVFATVQRNARGRAAYLGTEWAHPAGRHCFTRETARARQ